MKMLRVIYEWPPPWIGLTPAPFELTKAQSRLNHEITVFCGRWPRAGPLESINGVKVISFFREPVRGTMLLTVAPVMFLYFLFWRMFHKVGVYHIHGHFGLYIYLYKLLFGWADKTPVVAHYHICVKARWEGMKTSGKKIKFLSKYLDWPLALLSDKLAIRLASFYLFVGEKVKDDVARYYKADPSKCRVVESGVNSDLFYPPKEGEKIKLKEELGFKGTDLIISNIGLFVERKNIHLILLSLKHLPDNYKVMLVGKSDEKYLLKLTKIISDENLKSRVTFMGEKTNPETPKYFRASDVFVLPSAYEGFPKAVLESLACGVPTIVSGFEVPPIKGLFKIEKHSAEEIASLVLMAVESRPFVDSAYVSSNYSWDERARQIDEVYNGLVKK